MRWEHGVDPDVRTITAALKACEVAQEPRAALDLLRGAPSALFRVTPNVKSYNAVLRTCAKAVMADQMQGSSAAQSLALEALAAWATRPADVKAENSTSASLERLRLAAKGQK